MKSIQNNISALNAGRHLNFTASSKKKSTEKLSSGYRINRSGDDAAGLAISERMRAQIRGLKQGTKNGQDGISWLQIGDGALQDAQNIINRMAELTVQSLNDSNTQKDRAALQQEFDQLQCELDRIGTTTMFNTKHIFSEHEDTYYQCEGSVFWNQNDSHVIIDGQNDLTFVYWEKEEDAPVSITISVAAGEYTTQELIDEIDDALSEKNVGGDVKIALTYDKDGFCNANLEGGEKIDSVSGGLSYLMYDMFKGGGLGALIGTTIFPDEVAELKITRDMNDTMAFYTTDINGGNPSLKQIKIAPGSYNRGELIDILNQQLAGTSVTAIARGTGIMLSSEDVIVTGFKGNMFKIDGGSYTSVFYDNVKYGNVIKDNAVFTGGYVLTTDSRDAEHENFVIDDHNNVLKMKPNGAESSVDLVIDKGVYTADEMVAKLNSLFSANGFSLTADKIRKNEIVGTAGGAKNVVFEGIRITSGVKGIESKVGIDEKSSAYDTLFVGKVYNSYGATALINNETTANKDAWFSGTKILSGVSADIPLTINSSNDSFILTLKDTDSSATAYTITLTDKDYTSAADIVSEINTQIEKIDAYKGKVEAVLRTDGTIYLKSTSGMDMDTVSVSSSSKAYSTLFQGTSTTYYSSTQTAYGSTSLNASDGINGSSMTITVGGTSHKVTFPNSNPTLEQVKNAINNQVIAKSTPNEFRRVSATGSSSNKSFSCQGTGSSTVENWSDSTKGSSKHHEGLVGSYVYNNPAVLEFGPKLKDNMVINSGNNVLQLTLNGVTKTLSLDENTYSAESLKEELQKKIDQEFGTGWGGAEVTLTGKSITITSRLPSGYDGEDTSISCGTGSSSFLSYLNTTEKPAVCQTNLKLDNNIRIDGSCNEFKFKYSKGGNTDEISVTLDSKTYNASSLVSELNRKLVSKGVTASLSNGYLVLTSSDTGNDVSISYDTASGGSSAQVLYGSGELPADILISDKALQSSIVIGDGNKNFNININGTGKNVVLDDGTYTRQSFVNMLNTKLSPLGAEAYLSGSYLGFRTTSTGSSASLDMNYQTGGSAMKAMFGETVTPGLKAEVDGENLKITAVNPEGNKINSYISISSGSSAGLVKPTPVTRVLTPSTYSGYHSRKYSKLDGVDIKTSSVSIDQWNNDLSFRFLDGGTYKNVSVTLGDGTYTYDALRQELQQKLDGQIGAGKIDVTVDEKGVMLTSANTGSSYQFSNASGDFYWKVMCECSEVNTDSDYLNKDGTQQVEAYTIGRKNIRNGVEIISGVSDVFSFDLTYAGNKKTISLTLNAGQYNAGSLIKHLQTKIDEQLELEGLKKGLIRAQIGGVSSGVYGSDDSNSLNLILSNDIDAPAEGEFVIDGVSGGAAFEIFYQTEGKLIAAYIMGTKDLTNGLTVSEDNKDLSFEVDGNIHSITLDEGDYSAEEVVQTVCEKFNDANAPLTASLEDGKLKVSYKKMGIHEIKDVSGGGKTNMFFAENGRKSNEENYIQLSSQAGNHLELTKAVFSTERLGINSVCITRRKYAEKALTKLESAQDQISDIRSAFGSNHNRLETAIRNNMNMEENVQASESRIRDADMAREAMNYAKMQILSQAGESMMAQANSRNIDIVDLLFA